MERRLGLVRPDSSSYRCCSALAWQERTTSPPDEPLLAGETSLDQWVLPALSSSYPPSCAVPPLLRCWMTCRKLAVAGGGVASSHRTVPEGNCTSFAPAASSRTSAHLFVLPEDLVEEELSSADTW